MSTIYYWLGAVVFWGAIVLPLLWLGIYLWDKYKWLPANMWLWVKVFVGNKPIHFTQSKAALFVHWKRPHKRKWWIRQERNTIARSIRYSRRVGWRAEAE